MKSSSLFTPRQWMALATLFGLTCLVITGLGWMVWTDYRALSAPSPTLAPPNATLLAPTPPAPTPSVTTPTPWPTWTPRPVLSEADQRPAFVSGYCPFTTPEAGRVECGVVVVAEDHARPDSPSIRLAVARYHALTDAPAPDPVIYLSGGPGGAAIEPLATLYAEFIAPLLAERDVIVFDQRGTGNSFPQLACPDYIARPIDSVEREFRANSEDAAAYVNRLLDCGDWMRRRSIHLEAYTSAASAADVRDVAQALGYAQVNLYGVSYGTRLALTVMRDFPDVVRSAVLDSPAPVELLLYNAQAFKSDYALNTLFAGCAADPACAAAYPDLDQVYRDLVARLNQEPALIRVENPRTAWPSYFLLNGTEMTGMIFFGLQYAELIPMLPRAIYTLAHGDDTTMQQLLSIPLSVEEPSISIGAFLSINCHEEIFATTPEQIAADHDAYPLTAEFARASVLGDPATYFDLCTQWGAAAFDPREAEPVVSAIPTLILVGEYDPATPPPFGAQIAANLANGRLYVIPGGGHGVSLHMACPAQLARAFLSYPALALDTTCLAAMPAPAFTTP